jgi:hypothetical protein
MRVLKGTLPTEADMNETKVKIQLLNDREKSLLPQMRNIFLTQLRSAEGQLRAIRTELTDPRLTALAAKSWDLQKRIQKQWETLNTTLMTAAAYCT